MLTYKLVRLGPGGGEQDQSSVAGGQIRGRGRCWKAGHLVPLPDSCPQPEAAILSKALVGREVEAGGAETAPLQTFLVLGPRAGGPVGKQMLSLQGTEMEEGMFAQHRLEAGRSLLGYGKNGGAVHQQEAVGPELGEKYIPFGKGTCEHPAA